jgi:hypothetical protein
VTTIGVTSTSTVAACRCLMGCNYRTCSKQQYCRYNTYNTEYKKKPSIHYTIVFFYLFIRYNTSLHLLYVQTNSVKRILFIFSHILRIILDNWDNIRYHVIRPKIRLDVRIRLAKNIMWLHND